MSGEPECSLHLQDRRTGGYRLLGGTRWSMVRQFRIQPALQCGCERVVVAVVGVVSGIRGGSVLTLAVAEHLCYQYSETMPSRSHPVLLERVECSCDDLSALLPIRMVHLSHESLVEMDMGGFRPLPRQHWRCIVDNVVVLAAAVTDGAACDAGVALDGQRQLFRAGRYRRPRSIQVREAAYRVDAKVVRHLKMRYVAGLSELRAIAWSNGRVAQHSS